MRKIKGIIIHCSATKPSMDIGVEEITDWHINPKKQKDGSYKYKGVSFKTKNDLPLEVRNAVGNGWSDIGYHYVIRRNGSLEIGRDLEKNGAHCKGHNKNTIGICLIGGVNDKGTPQDNFTPNQYDTLESLLENLVFREYVEGGAYIKGHNELCDGKKACPSFNVQEWLDKVGLGI